jgi:tol-pal system protein YbgF
MITIAQRWLRVGGFTLLALCGLPALAQQPPQAPPAKAPSTPGPAPKVPAAAAPAPAAGNEAALRQRIEQLEEQLVDLQVVVGTLESLARGATAPAPGAGRPSPGPSAAIGAADAGRLDGIETQIRALAAQLEQVQEQMRALSSAGPRPPEAATEPPPSPAGPRPGRPRADADPPAQPERTGFGAVTVSPDGKKDDEIDRILSSPQGPRPGPGPSFSGPSVGPGPGPAAAEADTTPKQLYETAYGYLLQRDYGAAEAAFEEFLRRHPADPLAGNAQYWLGESLYVRGQYRAAAGAFLKGYQTYTRSAKAPENLLKLAMSLQRLGQKDAACSSYSELAAKFPSAPTHVKNTAQSERQRAGC